MDVPYRCPHCHAQVVDRRSPVCTTCRCALPADWVMTPEQVAALNAAEKKAQAHHLASMRYLDPQIDPNIPPIIKLLDANWGL